MTYLDTNVLIYLLEGHSRYAKPIAEALEVMAAKKRPIATSMLTITEFLASTSASRFQNSLAALQGVPRLTFLSFTEDVAITAARLQSKHASLHIGDAIHLATALESKATTLFTNDKQLAKQAAAYIAITTA